MSQQPNPEHDPELIGFCVDGGPEDGRIVIEQGTGSVARNTPGILDGLPKVEPWMREEGSAVLPDIDTEAPRDDGANRYSSFVVELSRKEELSAEEKVFVDRLADLGSRTVSYLFSDKRARIPTSVEFAEASREYNKAAYRYFDGIRDEGRPSDAEFAGFGLNTETTVAVLDRFSNMSPSVGEKNGSLRRPVEDCAIHVSTMLDEVIKENGFNDYIFDGYVNGNLENIAAHYDNVDGTNQNNR